MPTMPGFELVVTLRQSWKELREGRSPPFPALGHLSSPLSSADRPLTPQAFDQLPGPLSPAGSSPYPSALRAAPLGKGEHSRGAFKGSRLGNSQGSTPPPVSLCHDHTGL